MECSHTFCTIKRVLVLAILDWKTFGIFANSAVLKDKQEVSTPKYTITQPSPKKWLFIFIDRKKAVTYVQLKMLRYFRNWVNQNPKLIPNIKGNLFVYLKLKHMQNMQLVRWSYWEKQADITIIEYYRNVDLERSVKDDSGLKKFNWTQILSCFRCSSSNIKLSISPHKGIPIHH